MEVRAKYKSKVEMEVTAKYKSNVEMEVYYVFVRPLIHISLV